MFSGHNSTLSVTDPGCSNQSDWRFLVRVVNDLHRSHGLDAAVETVTVAIESSPGDGNLQMILGQILAASGRREEALSALSAAMESGTECEILDLVAKTNFPGPRYGEHLLSLHRILKPANYLEIGVFKGETLALAQPGTWAIGVDPAPLPESSRNYDAPTQIYRMTSDAYFAAGKTHEVDLPDTLDLAFIDGLHLFEQVLRDFINVEARCHPGSVIVLHDTLPIAAAATARQRRTSHWCGDVWKVLPILQQYRPELSLLTIPTHPSGLTLVTGLDPDSRILADHFEQAVAEFISASNPPNPLMPGNFGDIANDLTKIQDWLPSQPSVPRSPARTARPHGQSGLHA